MDTDISLVYIKTEDNYVDIGKDVETRSDTSNYELERHYLKEKNKKVTGLMKDEFGRIMMTGLLHWDQKHSYFNRWWWWR